MRNLELKKEELAKKVNDAKAGHFISFIPSTFG